MRERNAPIRRANISAVEVRINDVLARKDVIGQASMQRAGTRDVREQAELALRLPPRERLTLLLHAPRPMRLVRSLPDADLYLTVREIGPADAMPLMKLASASQILHLLDLESWRRDRFDGDRSGAWVALLLEADESALRRFLRTADDEHLALDLTHSVGPKGSYLAQSHTALHCRDNYWDSHYFGARFPRSNSPAIPDKELIERIDDDLREILATHRPEPLAEPVRKEIRQKILSLFIPIPEKKAKDDDSDKNKDKQKGFNALKLAREQKQREKERQERQN